MLTKEQAYDIYERARRFASVDEVEVIVEGGDSALTRFANNFIHQNVADETYEVSVRVAFDGKTARATTNKFDDESLKRTVEACEALARVQEPDPDLLPMVTPREAGKVAECERWSAETVAIGPDERADVVGKMVAVAKRHGHISAGIYAINDHMEALFNSRGVGRYHRQSYAEASITMTAKDSSGWQKGNAVDARHVDAVALAEAAAQKATDSASPRELPAGKYTVILEPSAVLDIVGFMFWDFSGLALLEQRSFLNDRMRTKLFGENITIYDDAFHPLQAGAAFDGEGVQRERLELVDAGVVKNLTYARETAARISKSDLATELGEIRPTGHGFPLPNEIGEMPMNVVFATPANPKSVSQMVAETERGILVTRLWYIREVEPYEKLLTGMTRDGTFLVENGKIVGGVRNFRFNESLIHMLSNVEAMSEPVRAAGEESLDMVVPAMKVRDFNFTEVTRF